MKPDIGKHQRLQDILKNNLKTRPFVSKIYENKFYVDWRDKHGEYDLMVKQGNHFVYYEVKSNNTYKARQKAKKQIKRGTKYWNELTGIDCYGVYFSPNKMILMGKNGELK